MSVRIIVIVLLLQGWWIGSAGMTAVQPHSVSSQDLSWSDDFQDGNYDDWLTYGGQRTSEKLPSNFTIVNGALFGQGPMWNYAFHDSEVFVGTWSMDLFVFDDVNELVIGFILENHTQEDHWKNMYGINIFTSPRYTFGADGVALIEWTTTPNYSWLGYSATGELKGWQHLDITRDNAGQICVYLNGSLYINQLGNRFTGSNLFCFSGRAGQGIDNVTVTDNLITIDKAPPIWLSEAPDYIPLQLNEPFRFDLNASDSSGIDTYWINDTTNFMIDDDGVITNRISLTLGTYGLEVYVNDTNGYTAEGSFSILVTESIAPGFTIPTEILIIGAIAIVVMIALVVVFMKVRRK